MKLFLLFSFFWCRVFISNGLLLTVYLLTLTVMRVGGCTREPEDEYTCTSVHARTAADTRPVVRVRTFDEFPT